MRNAIYRLAVAFLTAWASGCVLTHRHGPHGEHTVLWAPGLGTHVFVKEHSCSRSCDHYWEDERWYAIRGHVHGPRCGHHWINGRWVAYQEVRLAQGHRCNAHCGHYYYGSGVYYVGGHVHGPGCGHVLRTGFWLLFD